jgi:excisionase family DNA binding protein
MITQQLNEIEADHGDRAVHGLMRASDVAAILGISAKTVNKLVREKKLACVQVTARDRRFTLEQIEEYIRSQSTEVRVDKKAAPAVTSRPKKGGIQRKSAGDIGTDLVKEIRSLCR